MNGDFKFGAQNNTLIQFNVFASSKPLAYQKLVYITHYPLSE